MISFVKLSVVASIALIVAACSDSTDTTDSGTTTPDASTTDTGPAKDTGTGTTDTGTTADTSTGDDDAGGDGAAACQLPATVTGDPTCDACLNAKCCQPILDCGTDDACLAANNCVADCGDGKEPNDAGTFDAGDLSDGGAYQTCLNSCVGALTPAQQQELAAAGQCFSATCKTECGN